MLNNATQIFYHLVILKDNYEAFRSDVKAHAINLDLPFLTVKHEESGLGWSTEVDAYYFYRRKDALAVARKLKGAAPSVETSELSFVVK